MYLLVRSCCAKVALATAITTTVTAAHPAAHTLGNPDIRSSYPSVEISALVLAGIETALAEADSPSAQPTAATVDPPADTTRAVTPAASAIGDGLYDIVRGIAFWAGVALLPAWWIAFPVTFPIGYFVGQEILFPAPPNYSDFMGLRSLGMLLSAVALPPLLAAHFVPARTSSTTAATTPAASVVRSSAAATDDSAVRSDGSAVHSIAAAVRDTPQRVEPAGAAPSADVTGERSHDGRAGDPPVSSGNTVPSRRVAEGRQSHPRNTAAPRERKNRASAAADAASY
ncbi:MAG: hypothetical protein QG671_2480 [Actinomycetota bacterium]|nr:hypothetical protein [Actinomycetota bacterium]